MERRSLAVAVSVSAVVVLLSPFMEQLRAVLHQLLGDAFVLVMAVAVGGAVAVAIGYALFRIRDRRWRRYGALAAALVIGVGYALAARSGDRQVDAVERFHFIEYGVIAALFYNVWRRSTDAAPLVLPVLAGITVGITEEWVQWFVPFRVGELRDIWLNTFAVVCGLLFALGTAPPPRLSLSFSAASRRSAAIAASAALVAFGVFFQSVHLGHEIADRDAGVFRSRYTAKQLAELGRTRAQEWRQHPPANAPRLSREDQYLSEGIAHVRRRNAAWDEGNVLAARHENLILEKYFAPVLDTPSAASAVGHRWPEQQRAAAYAHPGPGFMIYESDALPYPVYTWPAWALWAVIALLMAGILRAFRFRT